MSSTFAQRLDFLMRLTNTQNSMLARVLNFDASYISRIRAGRRGMPRHQPFVEPAAAYFAANLTEPYQRKAVADAICRGREWPDNEHVAASLIVDWLRDNGGEHTPIEQFLDDLFTLSQQARTSVGTSAESPVATCLAPPPLAADDTAFFYGNEGKRAAITCFLEELVALGKPVELLLLSDEHMSWLHEDANFEHAWSELLMRIISQGGTLRIVHASGRGLDQILSTVEKWLPLYAVGHVESWRYPKTRNGVHRRTLFVAREHAAIVSNSIGDHTEGMLNLLLHDRRATKALEQEFDNYLELCHLLMRFDLIEDSSGIVRWSQEEARAVRGTAADTMMRDAQDDGFGILVREAEAATLFCAHAPSTVVVVEDPSIVAALWDHLSQLDGTHKGRTQVAYQLDDIASRMSSVG